MKRGFAWVEVLIIIAGIAIFVALVMGDSSRGDGELPVREILSGETRTRLSDGCVVTCIEFDSGLSCDWGNKKCQ